MSSSQLDDLNEEKRDRFIADKLGITYEELGETNFDTDTDESDEGLIYSYFIRFKDGSSQEVLDKIDGLENNQVSIDLSGFPDKPEEEFDSYDDGNEMLTDEERKIAEDLMYKIAEENRKQR